MDHLLTIGELARRCGLSRSALRFYDECGLLRPVAVDDATGYRYYESSQVSQAQLIRRLRSIDMPVEGVRAFLAAGLDQRRRLLAAQVGQVAEHLAEVRNAADELSACLDLVPAAITPSCVLSGPVLAGAITQVGFAAARAGDGEGLTGILVEAKEESLRLVATDSYRLAIRDLIPDQAMMAASLRTLVSAGELGALREALASVERCDLGQGADGSLALELDGRCVTLAALAGEFPDYEQVLLGNPVGRHCVVGRRTLAAAFDGPGNAPATISFSPTHLRVAGNGRSTMVPTRWDGGGLTVTVNARFIAEALDAHIGPDVAIEAIDALRPLTFRSADAGTLSVLVMPIRTDR
jgi:DNA polymerase-3 subunit beta